MTNNGELLSTESKAVGILIYPDAELLDFCGPFQVFASARLNEEMRRETASPIRQYLVAESTEPLKVSGGMRMLADMDFGSCPSLDMLIVPGGSGVRALMHQTEYLEWIKSRSSQVEWLAAVGTGSLLLAEAELLVGKSATTLFHSVDLFRERYPRTTLLPELAMVVDGNIVTSSSIRAGIEMALYLVAQSYGHSVAREAARQMEYPYPETPSGRKRNGSSKSGPDAKQS